MHSNALRKEEYIQDNFQPVQESWEVRKKRIAAAIAEACALPDNNHGPDLAEFEDKYLRGTSSFA